MMIEEAAFEGAAIGTCLLDDVYLTWFSAESECEKALHGWFEEIGEDGATAYFAYQAALDREEAAARDLQRLSRVSRPCGLALVTTREEVPNE